MTGGPQSVSKRSVLIVWLSLTIARRSPPIGDQSLTVLWQVFAIPPICIDCRPLVGDWLATEVGDWSWPISDHRLVKTSENLNLTTENHCTAFADRKRLIKDYWKPLCNHLVVERYLVQAPNTSLKWRSKKHKDFWGVGSLNYYNMVPIFTILFFIFI